MTEADSTLLCVVCSVACLLIGMFYFRLRNLFLQAACHLGVPAIFGMSAYWIWNWEYRHEPAYRGWDIIFAMQVTVVAIPASVIGATISKIVRKRISRHWGTAVQHDCSRPR